MCSTAGNSKKSDDFPVDDIFEDINLSDDETKEAKPIEKTKEN